jgi:hypothetical protein
MPRFASLACLAAVLLPLLPGCSPSKLRYEKSIDVGGGEEKILTIDAPKKEEKVKIEVTAGQPVSVTVTLKKNLNSGKPLASKSNEKDISLEVTVPAGEEFCIILSGIKQTTATVKANSL